ncbi:3-phosphoshikimate 1-carboxyvinyltransferase [Aquimarina intermedia]|uniref:3-phosphoshikimate 1-carboxyvinyltransferase n=1 Tax=Aquimarina intermedia TaxID=350814 RepID=A0A5S5C960_9FLAO|nr:3-phosphoshikimate 1-carboxyvinyltransferase [Aquimarina intermedia]TYP75874.1 3-phosphoshikimate 1-carboxyvinyltransferase [Aquimarina intermedia]
MKLNLAQLDTILSRELKITGSKSETNRSLLLQAFYPELLLRNVSNSDDANTMREALAKGSGVIDVHHAGTAMRFLTAYFAVKPGVDVILTGSERMQQRPIKILVDALRTIGCQIEYLKEEGYPPLKIQGVVPVENSVSLKANVSSQYISALMLIGSSLTAGLTIHLEGEVTSIPYINMTKQLLCQIGIETKFDGNQISINPQTKVASQTITIESDWSSASYFYSMMALSNDGEVTLSFYKKESYQGDARLATIYKNFGVETLFKNDTITLKKKLKTVDNIVLNLVDAPDIAQTIAVTCFGLGISCNLKGLHTLKIKETDRLLALKTELEKLGGKVHITEDALFLESSSHIQPDITIETYNDHRMALAFAPLALKTSLSINDADVVTKSYPDFWNDLERLGFKFS